MQTITLSFRMPLGWPALLDNLVRQYHFNSRGEMIRLVLIEANYNTLKGRLKIKKGRIETPTVIIGCRLPASTHRVILDICCKQIGDTPSVWAALAVAKWVKDIEKEDNKQQKQNMYWLWLRDYAKNYRANVSRLQYEIARIMGVQQQ